MVPESLCLFFNVEQGLWFQNPSVYFLMWSKVYGSRIPLSTPLSSIPGWISSGSSFVNIIAVKTILE